MRPLEPTATTLEKDSNLKLVLLEL
uniref:Uncharacterized protein n=1 Tax=Anguilla anguilla TaxID=7936 RepID=A0A0E9U9E3_ANGAN